MITLDHVAVSGASLTEAKAHCEAVLGLEMQPGGNHDVFSTHNTLLGFADGLYLEAISIDPAAPAPNRPRWFDLDRFSGSARLTNWICRTDDLDAALAVLPEGFGEPVSLQRGDLRWRMAVPDNGVLPFDNCAPALIQWDCEKHPAEMLENQDIKLGTLTISHPDAKDLRQCLAPLLADERINYVTGAAGICAECVVKGQRVTLH